ncbi:MAG TPA: DUF366 family protein [bacterium]|jgi:hypothetical protein|nr:DUF366 family protein [bacterium]
MAKTTELAVRFLPGTHAYDGSPLGGHWAFKAHGIQGDSLLAFEGPCEVRLEALADLEDAKAGAFIYGPRMLHFVLELFGPSLEEAAARQWLMAATVAEELNARLKRPAVARSGNDLYVGKRKLSVSIAAPTGVSVKVHLGLNIDATGAPVPAIGLKDLKVPSRAFGRTLLERFSDDHARLRGARTKVRLYP